MQTCTQVFTPCQDWASSPLVLLPTQHLNLSSVSDVLQLGNAIPIQCINNALLLSFFFLFLNPHTYCKFLHSSSDEKEPFRNTHLAKLNQLIKIRVSLITNSCFIYFFNNRVSSGLLYKTFGTFVCLCNALSLDFLADCLCFHLHAQYLPNIQMTLKPLPNSVEQL